MPKKKLETLVSFILDKSGSMGAVRESTISGFNEYLKTLKNKKVQMSFSLTLFDTAVEKLYVNVPLKKIEELNEKTYTPDGMTALYDAVCQTIVEIEKTITKDQKSLVVIMTDGEENASQEYTQKELKKKIEELTKTKLWSFVFLGANQDAWASAQKFGISKMNAAAFNSTDAGITATFSGLSANTEAFAVSAKNVTSAFFSIKDQKSLKETK
jgi:uncharacterized protein YegL